MPRGRLTRAARLVLASTAALVLAGCGASATFPSHPAWLTSQEPVVAGGPPAFFIANEAWTPLPGYSSSRFIVRSAVTGATVPQGGHGLNNRVTAVAAVGSGTAFLAAEEDPQTCDSQLYWFRLDAGGRIGPLTPVGPPQAGEVNWLAASADGQTIAYTVSGCLRHAGGFLKVIDLRTGKIRRWRSVDLTDDGSLAVASNLALSASGRQLAFVGWSPDRDRATVRLLDTAGQTGGLGKRSRIVRTLSSPGKAQPRDAVALTPDGSGVYVCTVSSRRNQQVTSVAEYAASSGALERQVLSLPAADPAGGHQLPGCALAGSRDGEHALVPFAVRYLPGTGTASVSAAVISLASGQRSTISFVVRQDANLVGHGNAAVSISW